MGREHAVAESVLCVGVLGGRCEWRGEVGEKE